MRFYHRRDQYGEPTCHVYGCTARIRETSPVPVCEPHGIEIARVFQVHLDIERAHEARRHQSARESKKPPEKRRDGREVVYYVRIGDCIKIGYTRRLRRRMSSLRVTTDHLLAIEDGGRELEAQRHREFVGDRLGRMENFRPSEALLEHIERLGGRDSLPKWAQLPDTNTIRFAPTTADRRVP